MFYAVNSKTGEKVNSLTIETNPSYKFIEEEIWYADPDEIENCPKEINIDKIVAVFRKGNKEIINFQGTKYGVSPHFFIPNKTKLGINIIPESWEHKLAKNWIYNQIVQQNLLISYSKINKPYHYTNDINLFELPIDKNRIGIEINSGTYFEKVYRRADVICPFTKKHELLGNGIVFEIQFTNQKEKTRINRELDWAIRGYSVSWLYPDDFVFISEQVMILKIEKVPVESFANLIKINNKGFVKELKFTVQECCRDFDRKKEEINSEIFDLLQKVKTEILNEKTRKVEFDKEDIKQLVTQEFQYLKEHLQPICPKCHLPMIKKRANSTGDLFWGCANYPVCKMTSNCED